MHTKQTIGLLGSGRIYESLKWQLADRYDLRILQQATLATAAADCQLVLNCHDRWCAAQRAEIHLLEQIQQVSWLPVVREFGSMRVGPWTRPGQPGCFACAERRRLLAVDEIEIFEHMRERLEQQKEPQGARSWLYSWALQVLILVVEAEVTAALEHTEKLRTVQAVLHLQLSTLAWSRHRFLPDPLCALCGHLPEDSAEAAAVRLQPHQKATPTTFRVRSLGPLAEQMNDTYVDQDVGLIQRLGKSPRTPCPMAVASTRLEQDQRRALFGVGRTLNYKHSYLAAILEALERYSGQLPGGKRTVVRASFREIAAQALDPVTLGLPTPEQYAQPGYRYVPYQPDLVCDWVWGYSFGQQRALLVPRCYAYYGSVDQQSFVYEISNGCALGSCLEEAILYGLLEVLERDAFLLTWYAQLGVPRLDLASIPAQRIRWLLAHLEYTSGYTISIFNTTLLHGTPCCWVMGVDTHQRTGFPHMVCTAGSHLLAEEAILGALLELSAMLAPNNLQERFQREHQHAREMLHDPRQVKEMEDHSTLYMLPEAFTRLGFLEETPHQQTFQEAFGSFTSSAFSQDLTKDLSQLITFYQKQGTDTIVVNQTTPEQQVQGFCCVKVIMPGMLPMTFGQPYRRMYGFPRLAQWPVLLGYRDKPLADAEINQHPHPFP